jgi:hypothetical protein
MPSNLHQFLIHILNNYRLSSDAIQSRIEISLQSLGLSTYSLINSQESHQSTSNAILLSSCGYKFNFFRNLVPLLALLALLITLWLITLLYDLYRASS